LAGEFPHEPCVPGAMKVGVPDHGRVGLERRGALQRRTAYGEREQRIMPVKYVTANDGQLVVERWVGAISHAELTSHGKRQHKDAAIAPGAKVFVDARLAEFPETAFDLARELSDLNGAADRKARTSMCAAIFRGDDFDRAKEWETRARDNGLNVIVFSSLEVACTWLGTDPVATQKLLDSIGI